MSHLQFMPGDHQLVDQLVYELKSKGIFDQFRKECFADVDTKPAYQNLRQRVESSVQMFLSRQTWRPDLNKNQLREKLRKHILDGNYLEQGVNRIVDQVVNPKIASVFIPQVEELFYNHLGIQRPKPITLATEETSNGKIECDLLPTDLEAVSPGSVKSNDGKEDGKISGDNTEEMKMDIDDASQTKSELKEETQEPMEIEKAESHLSGIIDLTSHSSESVDNSTIPLPSEIKPENIPPPEGSPPKFELDKIELPKDKDIPLPEISLIPLPETEKESFFKPMNLGSDEDSSSSDSSLIRNMSPLTPVRNFDDENSCDAQQGFDNEVKADDPEPQPASFRFAIEADKSSESSQDAIKTVGKKDPELNLSYQFESQVNLNTYNTPLYEESSNSNNLQIDYESDVNSKTNTDVKLPELDQTSQEVKKEKLEEKKSHKSSHRSRDSHRHSSSSKDRRSDSKTSSSREKDSKHNDKKSSTKLESGSSKPKSSQRERSRDRSDKKDEKSRDSSKHRHSSHKSSSSSKDTKHRSSSSSQRHTSSKHDDKKTSSSSSHKDKSGSKDHKSKDSKSSSHRSDKDRKSSSSKKDEKDKEKKEKKETDDHYSLSGRGNINRRSTDRDSNDGNSTSSKGSNVQSRTTETNNNKKEKSTSSKSETTSTSSGTSPSDKDGVVNNTMSQARNLLQAKSAVRVENHLETTLKSSPARFMPEVVLKKPKFASNFEEAKKMMKMRKFMDEEQRRMNQEAALLLEFQANVRPSMSQVYSNISGPELEFACGDNETVNDCKESNDDTLLMEEISIEDFVIANDKKSDIETIESLADIQKEVDEFTHSDELKDDGVKEDVTRTSDDLLKDLSETEDKKVDIVTEDEKQSSVIEINRTEDDLKFFNQTEKYNAEIYRDSYSRFLKSYTEDNNYKHNLYLINCNKYEEDVFKEVTNGEYEIVTYLRNGHSCPQKSAKHVDFNNTEVTIPVSTERSPLLSPVKSECSFELSSDYDARLEDMMNTTSRQQIMEIILGDVLEDSPTKMPRIDICSELSIESSVACKRRYSEIESSDNNNRQVLTPNKIRKISGSDQISSTTEENDVASTNHMNNVDTNMAPRSKYLGKAKRIGLPRPRKPNVTSSPSSDKSVENYEQDSLDTLPVQNGRLEKAPRNKVQRYDTTELYKPKLHYLSRRNNVT